MSKSFQRLVERLVKNGVMTEQDVTICTAYMEEMAANGTTISFTEAAVDIGIASADDILQASRELREGLDTDLPVKAVRFDGEAPDPRASDGAADTTAEGGNSARPESSGSVAIRGTGDSGGLEARLHEQERTIESLQLKLKKTSEFAANAERNRLRVVTELESHRGTSASAERIAVNLKELSAKLKQKDEEVFALETANANLIRQLKSVRSEFSEKEAIINDLREENAGVSEIREKYNVKIRELHEHIDKLTEERDKISEKFARACQIGSRSKREAADAKNALDRYRKFLTEQFGADGIAEVAAAVGDIKAARDKFAAEAEKLRTVHRKADKTEYVNRLKDELSASEADRAKVRQESDNLRKANEIATGRMVELEKMVELLRGENEALKSAPAEPDDAEEKIRAVVAARTEVLEAEKKQLLVRIADAESERVRLEKENLSLHGRLDLLQEAAAARAEARGVSATAEVRAENVERLPLGDGRDVEQWLDRRFGARQRTGLGRTVNWIGKAAAVVAMAAALVFVKQHFFDGRVAERHDIKLPYASGAGTEKSRNTEKTAVEIKKIETPPAPPSGNLLDGLTDPSALEAEAKKRVARREYDLAVYAYLKALEMVPGSEDLALGLANVYMLNGDYERGIGFVEDFIRRQRRTLNLEKAAAELCRLGGQKTREIEHLAAAYRLMPSDRAFGLATADLALKNRQVHLAGEIAALVGPLPFDDKTRNETLLSVFNGTGNERMAADMVTAMLAARPDDRMLRELANDSLDKYRRKNWAYSYGQGLLNVVPRDARLRIRLASILVENSRIEEALNVLKEGAAQSDAPDSVEIARAEILAGAGETEKALRIYETLDENDRATPEILRKLVDLYALRGDLNLARITCHRVLRSEPEALDVELRLGNIQQRLGLLDEAEKTYRAALTRQERNPDALAALGGILMEKRQFAEAQGVFEQAIGIDPKNVTALSGLAEIMRKNGAHREAVETYRRAIAAGAKDIAVRRNFGVELAAAGLADESEKVLLEVIEENPYDAVAYYWAAYAIYLQDDPKKMKTARAYCEKAAQLGYRKPAVDLAKKIDQKVSDN